MTPWMLTRKRSGTQSLTGVPARLRKAKSVAARWSKLFRTCATESSFAFKCLRYVFRQRGVEVIRHGELTLGKTDGTRLGKWRRIQNGEQAGRFLRQGFRAFRRNPPVVNFNFNGQVAHSTKLHLHA